MLNVNSRGNDATCECMCTKCFLHFKPQTQQFPYGGILPEKYKRNWESP